MPERFSAPTEHLVVEQIDDGELIYDQRDNAAHHLDALASRVRRACTSSSPLEDIARTCDVTESEAATVLVRLEALGLVTVHGDGLSRRSMLQKSAGAALGAGLIASIVAPAASAQGSCVNPGGAAPGACVSGAGNTNQQRARCCTGQVVEGDSGVCTFGGSATGGRRCA